MSRSREIQDFLEEIEPKIRSRGEAYFESGRVEEMEWNGNQILALVSGSREEPYVVELCFAPNGRLVDWSCDCPYDFGDVCKHIVAVLLAVQEEPEREKGKTPPFSAMVREAKKEQLDSLLLEYAKRDRRFRTWMTSRLKIAYLPLPEAAKEEIKACIRANIHDGFVDEKGCDCICAKLDDTLDEVRRQTKQGLYSEAMECALFVLSAGLKLPMRAHDSTQALGYTMDAAIKTVGLIATELAKDAEERKKWAGRLLDEAGKALFDDFEDWRYAFLLEAAKLADEQTEEMFYELLDHLREDWRNKPLDFFDKDGAIRYCVLKAARGLEKARDYAWEHVYSNALCIILLAELMEEKNYPHAERLCRIAAKQPRTIKWFRPNQWEYRLYEVYEAWGRKEMQIAQAQKLTLLGDREFYLIWKKLLTEEGRWNAGYSKLLGKLRTGWSTQAYLDVLAQENAKALLIEQLELHPEEVFRYGGGLCPQYGSRVRSLCVEEIRKASGMVGNRQEYRQLCEKIAFLAEIGGAEEALKIAKKLRSENPRRFALLEELGQVEASIVHKGASID